MDAPINIPHEMWESPGLARTVRANLYRLLTDTVYLLDQKPAGVGDKDACHLVMRLGMAQRDAIQGECDAAAEALQWFQWEVFIAQLHGLLSHYAAERLIEEAQALCEALWTHDREAIKR